MIRKPFRAVFLLLLFGAVSLFAKITGDLQVRVADATQAVTPNATVTVRNLETGATRTVTTDSTGWARISQLAIGSYEIQVSLTGFNTTKTTAEVASGDIKTIPITLSVASANQ